MHLNKTQERIAWTGAILVMILGLFPPWLETISFTSGLVVGNYGNSFGGFKQTPLGYTLIFEPPKSTNVYASVSIDVTGLLISLGVVTLGVGGGCVYFRNEAEK